MYLRINLDEKQEQAVRDLLTLNKIAFIETKYCGQMLFKEEAENCLRIHAEEKFGKDSEEKVLAFIAKYEDELAEKFFNDDYVIDNDALADLTRSVIEED